MVYYSTKAKDLFTADDFKLELANGDKNPIWITTPPADLRTVTAVAVDCRKDVNGVDFVLGGDMFMRFNINMNSPFSGVNNSVAYNNAYIYGHNNTTNKNFDLPSADLNANGTISHFYDLPEWAGDEYVFMGWYHAAGWSATDTPDSSAATAVGFGSDTFTKTDSAEPQDYHIYARWIRVGTVTKSGDDKNNYGSVPIRGFGIAGVQIRDPGMGDQNYNNAEKPQGMRFITSMSEALFTSINAVSSSGVEYGYVVGTEKNINSFIEHYGIKDVTKYKLQYKGSNVNGVHTDQEDAEGSGMNDFRYVTNVNCTSNHGGTGVVQDDHENFSTYRLYTLVVTYGNEQENKSKKLDARAYIRYTDANGMIRVFYNDYRKNMYYGGCLCSFNQVSELAIPKSTQQQAAAAE